MPSVSDHKSKAAHNENFASSLTDPNLDWAVTALFYAAVHYVEAFFATNVPPQHYHRHTHRDTAVGNSAFMKPIWPDYRELKNQSRTARYEAHVVIGDADLKIAKTRWNVIKSKIAPKL